MDKILNGQATPEQIEAWKKEHNIEEVKGFITESGIAYFKKPSRVTLKAATDGTMQGLSEYNDIVAENCFIGGDKSILTDPDYYDAFNRFITVLAQGKKAEIVNF